MKFVPAGEIIGAAHQVREVTISGDPQLPEGGYVFLDHYCTEPGCDCRKTMIQIIHGEQVVSVINYGWEPPEYYCAWMGMGEDDEIAVEMSGVSVDLSSPDRVSRDGALGLINHLLDDNWKEMIKRNYGMVRDGI